jgi:hypothetical protein
MIASTLSLAKAAKGLATASTLSLAKAAKAVLVCWSALHHRMALATASAMALAGVLLKF